MTWTTRRRSDLGTLRAIVAGQGAPLLLIHGVGLRAEAWGAQIDALSDLYHMRVVDLPGHGHSACPTRAFGLSDYTNCIAACLDRPALVVGHSLGAMIALDLAARHPHLVQGVVAMNAIFQRDPLAQRAVRARASALDGVTAADPTHTLTRWFGDTPCPERDACAQWLTAVDPAGYAMAYRVFAEGDGPPPNALRGMARPALFLTGEADPNSTPAMSQAMADLTPNGRAQSLEGAAHMMPMTHGAEVNEALRTFARTVWG